MTPVPAEAPKELSDVFEKHYEDGEEIEFMVCQCGCIVFCPLIESETGHVKSLACAQCKTDFGLENGTLDLKARRNL